MFLLGARIENLIYILDSGEWSDAAFLAALDEETRTFRIWAVETTAATFFGDARAGHLVHTNSQNITLAPNRQFFGRAVVYGTPRVVVPA